ncbi:MAG: cell division protein FtsA, partial [Angelakisella sp.]
MQDGRDTAQQEYLFALDIGTRSVIGIVGKRENGLFHVVDVEREEHKKRAMFDGQIEDIEQVAKVAGLVKSRLEQRLGTSFSHVCVAAAGRSLRTSRASFEMPLNP